MQKHSPKERVKALIQHICSRVPVDVSGVIKLNKIMWFSETETMYRTGKPLTGHMYIRQRFGPVALNAHMLREELIREGALEEIEAEYSGHRYSRFAAKHIVALDDYFTPEQIDIINGQIERFKNSGAHDISDLSHDSVWASLEDADEMPLELYRFKPVYTQEQKQELATFVETRTREDYGQMPA